MLNAVTRRQLASYKDPSLTYRQNDLETREGFPGADTLEFLTGFLRRQWWMILVMTAVGMSAGAGFCLKFPPNFSAAAELLIDNRKFQLTQQPPIVADAPLEAGAVDSQLELL